MNRSADRGQELTTLLREKTPAAVDFVKWDGEYSIPVGTDIVVNSTSIGLFPNVDARLALNMNSVSSDMLVADVIPNPPRTNLIQEAEAKGCTVIDGLGMLVNQGVIGIKYWTGIDVDPTVMRAKLEEIFSN